MTNPNAEFLHTVPTNVGPVTFIVTERKERPTGLRKPYEYIVPKADFDRKFLALARYLRKNRGNHKFQFADISKKSLSKGVRINIFLLAYVVGYTGNQSGCTQQEWEALTSKTQELFFDLLGPDGKMYIDPYTTTAKFQARIETYIAFPSLLGENNAL